MENYEYSFPYILKEINYYRYSVGSPCPLSSLSPIPVPFFLRPVQKAKANMNLECIFPYKFKYPSILVDVSIKICINYVSLQNCFFPHSTYF